MKADAILFAGILVFLFILWVYNGGPNNPISFAGPYITPVTDVGVTSVGYGSTNASAGSSIWESVTSAFGSDGSQSYYGHGSTLGTGTASSYANSVSLSGGDVSSTDVHSEYVTIRVNGSTAVDITGWRLVSEKTGEGATIGQGVVVAKRTDDVDIMLANGNEAIVTTGRSPISDSFLETSCTGYLDTDNGTYSPDLSTSRCPTPLDELSGYYGGTGASTYDKCEQYVSGFSSCRVPTNDSYESSSSDVPNSCRNFIHDELNYNGCVSNHRTDADFQGTTWRVYLDQSRELWRGSNDTIDLLDRNGNRVAQYSY